MGLPAAGRFPGSTWCTQALQEAVTVFGVAVQHVLGQLQELLQVTPESPEDAMLELANLYIPIISDQERTQALARIRGVNRDGTLKQHPAVVEHPTSAAQARPWYANSYHMVELTGFHGRECVRCEAARRFFWRPNRGPLKDKLLSDVAMIDPTQGLQGLLKSWLKPDLSHIPSPLRAGVCQQAAQQLNSYLGLRAIGAANTQYPSLLQRDPYLRSAQWRSHLERLLSSTHLLQQVSLRELDPDKYTEEDEKGDRLVLVDEDWRGFIRSPFPKRFPLNFVKSTDVVLYCYQPQDRLFAALPIFRGVPERSVLGRIAQHDELFWWHSQVERFAPLPFWAGRILVPNRDTLLMPISYHRRRSQRRAHHERFRRFFTGIGDRRVCWSLVVERPVRRGGHTSMQRGLQMPTVREVAPNVRPHVLGIHFGTEPIAWWHLLDGRGHTVSTGRREGNEILNEALRKSLRLREEQKELRWVGGRKFEAELRRRTVDIARQIVQLAEECNANMALEVISWVRKSGGNPEINRRFSLWNYSQLLKRIRWQGHEWAEPVETIAEVSDYILRYTCPSCGACRKAKQKQEDADTWREADVLHCRKCGYEGMVPDDLQARLVAQHGLERLRARIARQSEDVL